MPRYVRGTAVLEESNPREVAREHFACEHFAYNVEIGQEGF